MLEAQNGSSWDIYVEVSATHYEKFTKDGTAPQGWSTSNRSLQAFLKNHQETYDGRVAIDMDPDFDGISTIAENACGLNPNSNDTDGDGILDGIEYRGCADFDGDSHPDADDTDSDADGIPDQLEDKNLNGFWDAGETNALGTDSDFDGIPDGTEDANRDGVRNAPGGVFNETSPIDQDSDDDGIDDYAELHGTWCYVWESTTECDGSADANRELDPLEPDYDGDGLWDGQEIGLSSPGKGTDATVFHADANPKTTTDPQAWNTDSDGQVGTAGQITVSVRQPSGVEPLHGAQFKVLQGTLALGACTLP